jgi:plasmid stabilization system protein ParE
MSYKVEILPQALSEIEDAFRWIADNVSAITVELWYEDLLAAVSSLKSFPNRCTIAPEAQEFQQEIRQRWIGKSRNYRVLFVVEANQVFIVHIRHSSRAFLKKDPEES